MMDDLCQKILEPLVVSGPSTRNSKITDSPIKTKIVKRGKTLSIVLVNKCLNEHCRGIPKKKTGDTCS